ncbi:PIN domain-containing protein [Streptomyces sp. NBC_01481]|uniref:PIN domain-containing protein n=1 Tax=Streptomyces sp. NBC_01481 TaxID=2975869 RepID=UPI002251427D|nr:PIN domain-containing protein [Streptomyces sp. NBC_01481]MCX4583075.1 PIN domain-containing protein [Streptomyces sp. NBC_01481]
MDSSALLTLLTGRSNAAALRSFLAARSGVPMATSTLGFVETVRQLDKVGSYPNALADLDGMVTEILLTEDVRNLATRVSASLRSLDAIHVASALAIGEALDSLITYDKRMLDAARQAGLAASAPGVAD